MTINRMLDAFKRVLNMPAEVYQKLCYIQEALGRIEERLHDRQPIENAEFKVYSQWGEDGVIQFLINHIPISSKRFIEFGVESYIESNTRFLLTHNNWSGLVIDGDPANIEFIKKDDIYWRFNLKAHESFITKDNINDIFVQNGLAGEIGILSVDIDGNDYWVLEAIEVVNPCIIICEYNSIFGPHKKVTTPYREDFIRSKAHYSHVYYGSSISALNELAESKGYSLVYGNKNGNNVFFVRNDLIQNLRKMTPQEAYVQAQFRESRDITGNLTFLSFEQRKKLLDDLDVYDLHTQQILKFRDAK